jgi:hypothetical protein
MRFPRRILATLSFLSLIGAAACDDKGDAPKPTASTSSTKPASSSSSPPSASTTAAAATTAAPAASGPALGEWKPYTSAAGRYTVLFPGTPKETDSMMPAAGGQATMHMAIVTVDVKGPDTMFAVAYLDAPGSTPVDAKKGVDGAVEGMAKKGKVVKSSDIKLDNKYPGREATIELTEEGMTARMRVRVYMVGRRLLELIAVSDDANAAKFLDSFKVGK